MSHGRRKLLVEMATGTGKTRTAAAFVKRLFEAGIVTRVLFLVDRIALAGQAEDAFNDHLRDYPCHVLRPGRGFDRTKRITIATLQTMIPERNRAIVREFRDAHEKGFMGKDGVRRWRTWGKTIVFAVTKRHADTLAAMLDDHSRT